MQRTYREKLVRMDGSLIDRIVKLRTTVNLRRRRGEVARFRRWVTKGGEEDVSLRLLFVIHDPRGLRERRLTG